MDSFELNKIIAAVLLTVLIMIGIGKFTDFLFHIEKPKELNTSPAINNLIPIISNTKRMDEIKNSSSNNNALKLKRTKPLKRSHNNLESALGLIITPKT